MTGMLRRVGQRAAEALTRTPDARPCPGCGEDADGVGLYCERCTDRFPEPGVRLCRDGDDDD